MRAKWGTSATVVATNAAAGRLVFYTLVASKRSGTVRGEVAATFGRDAIVEVGFSAAQDQWNRYARVGRAAAGSFHFDPGRTRECIPPVVAAAPRPSRLAAAALAAGGAVGAGALSFVLVARIWPRRRGAPLPPAWGA